MKHTISLILAVILGFANGWVFTMKTAVPEYYVDYGVYFVTDAFGVEWMYPDI